MNQPIKPNRQDYLDGKLTHREYYLAVAVFIGASFDDVPFSLAYIKTLRDEHLNDSPLRKWDACDPAIRAMAIRAGYKSWALSDTVCVLKEIAKEEVTK